MSRNIELEERIIRFSASCVRVCENLPPDRIGSSNFSSQLFRSSTSVAANYAEASQAESARDFIHKLKVTLKELSESRTWLRIISDSNYASSESVSGIVAESEELSRILSASVSTARRRLSEA